jgi:colanic acid biosynthesis glycosyl transferase WcaI
MDILFLADNFPPEKNAQASRVYERACYWAKWGHRVTVITCAPNFPEGRVYPGYRNRLYQAEEMNGIRVVRVKTFISANRGKFRRIADFLSYMLSAFLTGLVQKHPDVVVATSPQFFAAVAGWALARVKRKPFVFELSDLWPESIVAVGAMKKSMVLGWLEKVELFLYNQSAAVVALTNAFKENLVRRGIPAEKIAVVMNGVDLQRYQPRSKDLALAETWGISPDEFVVSYIGTLGMAHGLRNVLDCAEIIDCTRVRFLLVGPGAERETLLAEAALRRMRNVTFIPAQPKERMPGFWSLSDIALVHLKNTPLFQTVIPSKIFEAMGMGLPILLAAPEGEASRIVLTENNGMWVQAGDPKALAAAIRLLEGNSELRRTFAHNSLAGAPRHSRERQAREMILCIEQAVALAGARNRMHPNRIA